MSTRANIILKEGNKKIYLYHHHDGYPAYVGVLLKAYLESVNGKYVDYCDMANAILKDGFKVNYADGVTRLDRDFELTDCIHGDIDYLYIIDAKRRTIKAYERDHEESCTYKNIVKASNEVVIPEKKA